MVGAPRYPTPSLGAGSAGDISRVGRRDGQSGTLQAGHPGGLLWAGCQNPSKDCSLRDSSETVCSRGAAAPGLPSWVGMSLGREEACVSEVIAANYRSSPTIDIFCLRKVLFSCRTVPGHPDSTCVPTLQILSQDETDMSLKRGTVSSLLTGMCLSVSQRLLRRSIQPCHFSRAWGVL